MEMDVTKALRREERITLSLRALYEQYGFRKYRLGRFEEYELYTENKNFLKTEKLKISSQDGVIDINGKIFDKKGVDF